VKCVEYSPDGRFILTASLDGIVRLWRSDTLEPISVNPIITHREPVTCAAFDPTGHRIVTGCVDGSVRVWDFAGGLSSPPTVSRSYSTRGNRFVTLTNQTAQVFDALTEAGVSPILKSQAAVERA